MFCVLLLVPEMTYYVWRGMLNSTQSMFVSCILYELKKKLLYNLPPHLKTVAALPCEIWMFNWTTVYYSLSIQKCAKSFIFSKYLKGCHNVHDMSMPIHLQCYSTCSKYLPSAHRHTLSRARHLSMDGSMVRCLMLSQAFNRRCRNLLHWCDVKNGQMTSKDTQKS